MKGKLSIVAASLLASLPAVAAINPASPGLPTVAAAAAPGATYATTMPRNQMSAMCVDCHTRSPKPAMGTHYVGILANDTNSGGTGVSNTGALVARDTGNYFKLSLWNASGSLGVANYSKYGNGATSFVPAVVQPGTGTATAQATLATYATYEVICESCHNVVLNQTGGNNLLATQAVASNVVNDYTTTITASQLCVGCHGFMYTSAAACAGNANCADARNTGEIGGFRGNNEWHFAYNGVQQAAFAQNHHVMTGDNINAAQAAAGVLWTDNLIVAYTDAPISNTSTSGTFPVGAAWTGTGIVKPANGGLVCTSCHAPGHGGGLDEGASILRNADNTNNADAGRAVPYGRIFESVAANGGGWKNIKDLAFCGQCHKN